MRHTTRLYFLMHPLMESQINRNTVWTSHVNQSTAFPEMLLL